MKEANLLDIFEIGASGRVVLKLKTGAIKVGEGSYKSFKPSLVAISGTIYWDGVVLRKKLSDPIRGTFEYRVEIVDSDTCKLLIKLETEDFHYIINDEYPYEMRGKRKMVIHSIHLDAFGQSVVGDLTIADAHDHATKYNPDFPLKPIEGIEGIDVGELGFVTRPVEYD